MREREKILCLVIGRDRQRKIKREGAREKRYIMSEERKGEREGDRGCEGER